MNQNDFDKFCNYVCYERSYNYILKEKYKILDYDKFYISRLFGYSFNANGQEPLIRNKDIYMGIINEIRVCESVSSEEYITTLIKKLSEGNVIQIAMEMFNAQNEPYYTSVLIEGFEGGDFLYTKISETSKAIREKITQEELKKRTDLSEESIELEILDVSKENLIAIYEKLKKDSSYFSVENGIEEFIHSQANKIFNDEINLNDKMEQLRFSKHFINKVYPIVYYCETQGIEKNQIEKLLEENYKISSICLVKKEKKYLDAYLQNLNEIDNEINKIRRNYEQRL